ncbi:MAG: hypothetical protein JWO36_3067 [Myxococcales bacterium]|nr:hypothetical protein [Myxococcales bacterium]
MTHRLPVLSCLVITSLAAGCAGPQKAAMPASAHVQREVPASAVAAPIPPTATSHGTGYVDVNTDNSLISNGSVSATSENLLSTASGFRREVYRLGGRVFAEQVHFRADTEDGPKEASSATYRVKLLPRLLPDVLDWLGKHSTITVQDVSSIVAMESEADAAIVRADVQARLADLEAQLANPTLDPQFRAALEQERTKLVGAAIADPNAMADNTKRVAVLDIRLEAPSRPDPFATGTLLGHARGSVLGLGILGQTRSNRIGGGVGIGGRSPVSSFEVIGYASPTMNERAGVTATIGFGGYSKAFGDGNRAMMNPYVGARLGYAYFDASYFAVAAEIGVELVKQHGLLWTVSARPMGLLGSTSQAAVEVGSSVGLAF